MVRTGDIVRVKVLAIDLARKRIALTMKLDAPLVDAGDTRRKANAFQAPERVQAHTGVTRAAAAQPSTSSAMAAAFAKSQTRR